MFIKGSESLGIVSACSNSEWPPNWTNFTPTLSTISEPLGVIHHNVCVQWRTMLPPELWDHTIDFLWTDPPALLSCALTCKTWLPTSQYHLRRETVMTIRTESMLRCVARVLCSKRSRRLFELVETIRIVEDPVRPFIRSVPFRLPASALPALTSIVMENIAWTVPAEEPHGMFFQCLSVLAHGRGCAVTVKLEDCRFRGAAIPARILRACSPWPYPRAASFAIHQLLYTPRPTVC